jgi:hypothetical protein
MSLYKRVIRADPNDVRSPIVGVEEACLQCMPPQRLVARPRPDPEGAAARVWRQLAARWTGAPGDRVVITIDPESAGIARTDVPDVVRLLADAAWADVAFWRRTEAAGVDFTVKPDPPAKPVEPVPTGPVRIGSPRPRRYR